MKLYKAILVDDSGKKWVYEGDVQGVHMWVEADKPNRAKLFERGEAMKVAFDHARSNDEAMVQEATLEEMGRA